MDHGETEQTVKDLKDQKLIAFSGSLLTLGGLAAAFGLASCCALPLLLAGLGLGTAWLTAVALLAVSHRSVLLVISALALCAGAALLWRQQRRAMTCTLGEACASPTMRALNLLGLLIGAILLWAGYTYV